MIPPPNELPLEWDRPIIAGRTWPGVARVEGCEQLFEWQENKAKASDGGTLNYQGAGFANPRITFVIWMGWDELTYVDYFAEWETFKAVFEIPVDAKDPQAITIEHPQFAHAKIRGVVTSKIGDLKPSPDGRCEVTVELKVWRPPKKAGGTPKSSTKAKDADGRPESEAWAAVRREAETFATNVDQLGAP